jgi:hypothetical protein
MWPFSVSEEARFAHALKFGARQAMLSMLLPEKL